MGERARIPLVFGSGLDRSSGVMAAEPSTFADLRNVHLHRGRAELRGGLLEKLAFDGDSIVIAEHPISSQGVGVAITYNTTTRNVGVHVMAADGSLATLIGTLWTLPAGSPIPIVICADSYDKLFVAHDEPDFDARQITKVYDPMSGTISDLTGDLDGDGMAAPIKFRGVTRHLNYLVGWGYGTEALTAQNRPEIVRVSLPGEPTVFKPEHYFIAGQRGDPVVICVAVGGSLAVRKAAESYEIIGYDRSTFGIRPLDTLYGCVEARLSVNVGIRNYFWSLEGPRMSLGGASEDLSLDLGLDQAPVDALAAVTNTRYAFATYVPDKREVWFVFGRWVFTLHLSDDDLRWSYNEITTELISAGLLYSIEGVTGVGGPSAIPDFSGATYGPDPVGNFDVSRVNAFFTVSGDLIGNEIAELWLRSKFDSAGWFKATELSPVVDGINQFPALDLPQLGVQYDTAVRLKSLGVYAPAYRGTPDLWPTIARGDITTRIPQMDLFRPPGGTSFADPGENGLRRKDAETLIMLFVASSHRDGEANRGKPAHNLHPELRHRLDFSPNYNPSDPGSATWITVFDEPYSYEDIEARHDEQQFSVGRYYRYQIFTTWAETPFYNDPFGHNPILGGVLFELFQPYPSAIPACSGSDLEILVSLLGHFPTENDIGTPDSVDTVLERRVNSGAWTEIYRETTDAPSRPESFLDTTAPESALIHYRARWEITSFAVTDIGPWLGGVEFISPNCP